MISDRRSSSRPCSPVSAKTPSSTTRRPSARSSRSTERAMPTRPSSAPTPPPTASTPLSGVRVGGRSLEIAQRLETGSAVINGALAIYHCFGVPMGGVKQSGIGRRHAASGHPTVHPVPESRLGPGARWWLRFDTQSRPFRQGGGLSRPAVPPAVEDPRPAVGRARADGPSAATARRVPWSATARR